MAIDLNDVNKNITGLNSAVTKVKELRAEITKTGDVIEKLYTEISNTSKQQINSMDEIFSKFKEAKSKVNEINTSINDSLKTTLEKAQQDAGIKKGLSDVEKIQGIRNQLLASNNVEGLDYIDQIAELNKYQAIRNKITEINTNLGAESKSLLEQKQANLLSEFAYQEKLAELHNQTAGQLKLQISELEALKSSTNNISKEDLEKSINQANKQKEIIEARTEGPIDMITRSSINKGLNENLGKVITDKMTFADMTKGILGNIQSQIQAQLMKTVSDILTQMTMNLMHMVMDPIKKTLNDSMGSLFNGMGDTLKPMLSSVDSVFGGFFSSLFKGTGGNFQSLTSGQGLTGIFSLVSSFFLAEGGMVKGPGTETSDSIPAWLSNGEFVTRAAVVKQPGMLPFLYDINSRGLSAVADYALRIKHATGGVAGIPAPSRPSLGLSSISPSTISNSTTVENAVNLHVYDDPKRIIGTAFGENGMKNFYLEVSRDPQKLKSILQI